MSLYQGCHSKINRCLTEIPLEKYLNLFVEINYFNYNKNKLNTFAIKKKQIAK